MVEANPSPSAGSGSKKKSSSSGDKNQNSAAAQEASGGAAGSDNDPVASPVGSQSSGNARGSISRSSADNHDHLRIERDQEIMSQFKSPEMEVVVMFSCRIKKYNKYLIKQERNFVISNLNLYNFKQKKLQRVVPIKSLTGLTKLLKAGT